jgi:hypothetical protein
MKRNKQVKVMKGRKKMEINKDEKTQTNKEGRKYKKMGK